MGVAYVLQWNPTESQSPSQAMDALHTHLTNLQAKKISTWCIDCEQYASTNMSGVANKSFQLIHTTDAEQLSFAITDQGNAIVAERSFDTILTKLMDCYLPNKLTKIEAKGTKWEIGDFLIKTGNVFLGPSLKSLVLEVEYMPSVLAREAQPLLQEFLGIIASDIIPIPDSLTISTVSVFYQPSDTIAQYVRVFNDCRRVAR